MQGAYITEACKQNGISNGKLMPFFEKPTIESFSGVAAFSHNRMSGDGARSCIVNGFEGRIVRCAPHTFTHLHVFLTSIL